MITKQQAIELGNHGGEIHRDGCTVTIGPRGGVTHHIERWRANGKCKTWKTRPDEFKLPIKHGLWTSHYITEKNCDLYHRAEDCEVPS